MEAMISNFSLHSHLQIIKDPRIDRTKRHELIDILTIAVCATICGCDTWSDIEDFGNSKLNWFKSFLNLNHGIPSHDTFRRIFLLIDPNSFRRVFINWVKKISENQEVGQVCIDGKTLRKSFNNAKKSNPLHIVNAWSTGLSLSLGQMKTDEKSNEITAVPKLLKMLNLKGCLVSSDALNTQKNIAKVILEQEADYLLALKNNHKILYKRVTEEFEKLKTAGNRSFIVERYKESNDGHGRKEVRKCTVLKLKKDRFWLIDLVKEWPSLTSIIKIENERVNKKTGEIQTQTRYYISSALETAESFLRSVRRHWEVENKLHWVLDVVFKEDDNRARTGHGPENLAILRQFALNLIKLEPSKKSIRRKRNISGWDNNFLLKILIGAKNLDA